MKNEPPPERPKVVSLALGRKAKDPKTERPVRIPVRADKPATARSRSLRREVPPPYAPTDQDRVTVRLGALSGLSDAEIAQMVNFPDGITIEALHEHFDRDLESGANLLLTKVASNLLTIATRGSGKEAVTAAIFVLTSRAGWQNPLGGRVHGAPPRGRKPEEAEGEDEITFTLKIGAATAPGAPSAE